MRTVTYGAACSADGFIAGVDGSYDWIRSTKDANAIMADYWQRIDTLVMGRKTWDIAKGQGGGGGMPGVHSYVFSRTLDAIDQNGVTLVKDDAAEFVRELKRRPGKEICVFGGGEFARALFAGDVIDEVGFNMHPVLLGAGIPLFRDAGQRIDLDLKECRPIGKGCVYMVYKVRHRARGRNVAANSRVRSMVTA
jgi:dihydrofolate reductase